MKRFLIALLTVVMVLGCISLVACNGGGEDGATTATTTPPAEETTTPPPEETTTPPPTPGIGVPVVGDSMQVTVESAREETRLEVSDPFSPFPGDTNVYTPSSGYTFLVLEVTFLNLDPDETMSVRSGDLAVITGTGEAITPSGGARQGEDCCDLGYVFLYVLSENPLSLSLAFIVEEDTIDQVFKFQFLEVPLIPFSVGEQT